MLIGTTVMWNSMWWVGPLASFNHKIGLKIATPTVVSPFHNQELNRGKPERQIQIATKAKTPGLNIRYSAELEKRRNPH